MVWEYIEKLSVDLADSLGKVRVCGTVSLSFYFLSNAPIENKHGLAREIINPTRSNGNTDILIISSNQILPAYPNLPKPL